MNNPSWRRSRYGFATFWFLSLLAAWSLLRIILFFAFRPAGEPLLSVVLAFLAGFQRDVFAALLETLPLLFWLWIIPDRTFLQARWHRVMFLGGCFLFAYIQLFLLFVEFFFFDEFKSRFNTVAVDYLIYPKEVFVNIWESYHVGIIFGFVFILTLAWLFLASRLFDQLWENPSPAKVRLKWLGAVALLSGVLAFTFNFKGAHVGNERTLNEIANNGALSFISAAWTRNLNYDAFYKTMPLEQAYERTRRILAENSTQFEEPGASIRRKLNGDPSRPRLNLVVFLEESLGSEFWGCLGRPQTLTPEMDKLATEEGMLFTNIYACGNRTVRGMEGVLSSFPPLPGDSIVK